MYRKDQIKGIVAIILFSIIGISFLVFPDSSLPEIISIFCFLMWLVAMYFINKKFNGDKENKND